MKNICHCCGWPGLLVSSEEGLPDCEWLSQSLLWGQPVDWEVPEIESHSELSWSHTRGHIRTCRRRCNDQRSTVFSLRLLSSPPPCLPCHPIILTTFSLKHWYSNKHQHNFCVYLSIGTKCYMCKRYNTMLCSKCRMLYKYICCFAATLRAVHLNSTPAQHCGYSVPVSKVLPLIHILSLFMCL